MNTSLFDWIYKLSRWGLGGIFIYAGCIKLLEPETFAVLIDAYGIIPENLLMPVAVALPALELAAGIGLLFDIKGSLSMISGLLGLFIAILGYGIWLGLDVDCGCFGPEEPEAKAFHGLRMTLYRDLVMLTIISFIFGWRRYRAIKPVQITLLIKNLWGKRRRKDAFV
ncbi:MAG: DoxX family membrane protein [Proteobacteria bacterium]|nr:DoxX family membrane protein [Pseudomonadota bacterium]MBU1712396.1 DoxX family membrane protein [Pseudomonadota bacterium]